MLFTIRHPEYLNITNQVSQETHFGGNQEWYADQWNRMSGCGPTAAANLTAYLAFSHPHLRPLYAGEDRSKAAFALHMEEIYAFVKPGHMGLNRLELFTEGMEKFMASRHLAAEAHVFHVDCCMRSQRPPVGALAAFAQEGLESDCPLAFLNLSKGLEKNLQSWHWITITGLDVRENQMIAMASDEGRSIRFDLRRWYLSTRMRGGLVYYTPFP